MFFPKAEAAATDRNVLTEEIRLLCFARVAQAMLLLGIIAIPQLAEQWSPKNSFDALVITSTYAASALLLLALSFSQMRGNTQVICGILLDLLFANIGIYFVPQSINLVGLMLMLTVCGAGLLSLPFAVASAMLANATLILQPQIGLLLNRQPYLGDADNYFRYIAFTPYIILYLLLALFTHRIVTRLRQSNRLNLSQETEIESLASFNEKILHRLPVGVLVVNGEGDIINANFTAETLLNLPPEGRRSLALVCPELGQMLENWQRGAGDSDTPLQLGSEKETIEPRFLRMHPQGDQVLVFLENTSRAAKRAEIMTLATLGRFSASLAHEIRNPLSAINYSAQLLGESVHLDVMERKMLAIIEQQVQRTNAIINSVLGIAKREKAHPTSFEVTQFVRDFAEEYRASFPLDEDTLTVNTAFQALYALADANHVHQILMILISNARYYGRVPGQPAHISLHVAVHGAGAVRIDVIDRGPGIPERAEANLFRPFFTTSEHGTGLGLYVASELAASNRGKLEYLRRSNGSCFRLQLPRTLE